MLLFGAQVTSPAGVPTSGSVTFSDENGTFATVQLDALGQATYSTTQIGGGIHNFTATYDPDCCSAVDSCFQGSSDSIMNYLIAPVLPALVLTGTPPTVVYGDVINLTATVTSYSVGTPTGSVSFYLGSPSPSTLLGTARIVDNIASMRVSNYLSHLNIPVGNPVTFNAVYSGDTNFLTGNFPPYFETINKAPVVVTLYSESPNPSFRGKTVNLTATVESLLSIPTDSGNSPVGIPPTGTVQFVIDGSNFGAPVTLVNGIATLSVSSLSVGSSHTIVAKYNGDSNFLTNSSLTYAQQVEKVDTQTTVTSSANPSTYNTSPIFTVNVASLISGQGTPTGTFTATYGSYTTGAVALSGGIGTFTIPNLQPGVDTIIVQYSGDANFNPSSAAFSQMVNQASTTMTLTSSVNPSVIGQAVTFTATVTPSAATGTVSFFDGATQIAIETMSGGVAAFTTSALTVGSHPITAVYSGDSTYAPVTSTLTGNPQVVNPGNTTTVLTSSVASPVVGQETVLTATVTPNSPASGTPTGTVTFSGTGISPPVTVNLVGGIATLPISFASAGTKNLTATYNGDSSFTTSSGNLALVVGLSPTTTVLTSSVNPSQVGQGTILTATVTAQSPGSGTPTGTVTFSGSGSGLPVTVPLVNGIATTGPVSFSPVGNYVVTATYNSDGNFSTSFGTLTQHVVTADTTTILTTNPYTNPSVFGQSITLQATVTQSTGAVPLTGTVGFYEGSELLGTGTISGGVATLTLSSLDVDLHLLTAVYSGDGNYSASTSPEYTQIVNKGATTTSLTSSLNPSTYGSNVTFTATVAVTAPAAGTPTGTVNFIENGMVIGTGTLSGSSPFTASINLANLTVGTHGITAEYIGDDHFNPSTSAPLSQGVNRAPTETTIEFSSPNPSQVGEYVTFVAITTADPAIAAVVKDPSGTVSFYDGSVAPVNLLGTVPTNGIAIFETDMLTALGPINPHHIIAVYNGDTNYLTSTSPAVDQVVNQTSQTNTSVTTLTSTPNPSDYGCPVTFTVKVAPLVPPIPPFPAVPTGTVTLYLGAETLTPLAVPLNNGMATITIPNGSVPPLPAGTLQIVALYSGDSYYSSSTAVLQQVVNPIATTMALTTSGSPSVFSQSVTFTATVGASVDCPPSMTILPTGSVSFYDGALPGGTLLGTNPLDGNGVSTLTTANLATGSHTITAVYNPDRNFNTTSRTVTQVVLCIPTVTTMLTAAPNPSIAGNTVTFAASVAVNTTGYLGTETGPPLGSMTFYDTFNGVGPTALGTVNLANGLAVLDVSTLAVGTHHVTLSYSGSTNFCASQLAYPGYQQVVITPVLATNTVLTSSLNPSIYGQNVVFTADVTDPAHQGMPMGLSLSSMEIRQ